MAKRRRTAKQRAASSRNYAKARAAALKRRRANRKPVSKKTKRRVAYAAATGVALGTGAVVGRHQLSGSKLTMRSGPNVSDFTGKKLSSGVRMSRRGVSIGVNNPRDAAKSHRTQIGYEHRKLTKEMLGQKLLGGPREVMDRRPPSARQRRKYDEHNYPMTEEAIRASKIQAQHSEGKVFGHKVRPKPSKNLGNDIVGGRGRRSSGNYSRGAGVHAEMPGVPGTITGRSARTESRGTTNPQKGRKISEAERMRRTNAFMKANMQSRRARATSKIKDPLTRHLVRTVVGGTYDRPSGKRQLRMERRASAYYASQPLYTGSGTPGRRGRARSKELRNRKK